jgi:hypothetical protein
MTSVNEKIVEVEGRDVGSELQRENGLTVSATNCSDSITLSNRLPASSSDDMVDQAQHHHDKDAEHHG